MMLLDLFTWWIISISWSIAFMIVIGIYLYMSSKAKREEGAQKLSLGKLVKNFAFTWVLLGLLVFYIISISIGSYTIFALGNIVVQAILILYVVKNGQKSPSENHANDCSKPADPKLCIEMNG
jgi:uncharacterized membrane protein